MSEENIEYISSPVDIRVWRYKRYQRQRWESIFERMRVFSTLYSKESSSVGDRTQGGSPALEAGHQKGSIPSSPKM